MTPTKVLHAPTMLVEHLFDDLGVPLHYVRRCVIAQTQRELGGSTDVREQHGTYGRCRVSGSGRMLSLST